MDAGSHDLLDAIRVHSARFAEAATGNLDAPVDSCRVGVSPTSSGTSRRCSGSGRRSSTSAWAHRPTSRRRPARPPADQLLETFLDGAEHLVEVLGSADGSDAVWTWAPAQHDVAFVSRHQVQEAAVHNWDAAHARGHDLVIVRAAAEDAVDEFLTFSVSSDADPADPPRPSLAGSFCLRCTDAEALVDLHAGREPGTVAAVSGWAEGAACVAATASDLLLWLYGRVQIVAAGVDPDVLARFRELCLTR